VPGYEVESWNALYAPAGTASEYVEILNGALQEVLADPEIKRRAAELGIETRGGPPAEADARMHGDIAKWAKVIAHANVPQQ
jgi:tripartite-type tricarboxylate transporter receptor subunit TctC